MDLKFNILWFEDDDSFYESGSSELEDFLSAKCLIPYIVRKKNYSSVNITEIGNKYDLIIVDYNLSNNEKGTDFIDSIRKNSLLPDISLYTSLNDFDEEIDKESFLRILKNGVYFSNTSEEIDRAKQIIEKIVKREEKINGFRGMFLASVSTFEEKVNNILLAIINGDFQVNDTIDYIRKDILKGIVNDSLKLQQGFEREKDLKWLLEPKRLALDHYKRVRIMNNILTTNGFSSFDVDSYHKEVLKLRNALGHINRDEDIDDEFYSFELDGEKIFLTHDYCMNKRKMLMKWDAQFNEILNSIDKKSFY